jgi:DNA invertase Pin-like site-specific DNA recombinase
VGWWVGLHSLQLTPAFAVFTFASTCVEGNVNNMANGKYVAYYRVSTQKQGQSGLGLAAQREAIANYLNGGRWKLVGEITEVESGKRNDRPALADALALCRLHRAILIIAKLDRLARNVFFISSLMESGVEFTAVDFPQANRLTIHVLAAVAEHEVAMISARTKAALAAAKARGTQLGGDHGIRKFASQGNSASAAKRSSNAKKRADDLLPIIREIQAEGTTTLLGIANELNERGIPAPRGGEWSAVQVTRVLAGGQSG